MERGDHKCFAAASNISELTNGAGTIEPSATERRVSSSTGSGTAMSRIVTLNSAGSCSWRKADIELQQREVKTVTVGLRLNVIHRTG